MFYLLGHLLGLVGLVGIFFLTGWLLDRMALGGRGLKPVTSEMRFGLGAAVWMGWVFLLASAQMLTAAALGLVALVTVVIAWRHRQASAEGFLASSESSSTTGRDLAAWLLGGLVTAVLVVLWIQVLRPQISWDSNVYHLTVPRLYLEQGGFRRIPFNVYSNWPLNTQMLYTVAMAAKSYVLAKGLHFAFGLATLLLVYRVSRGGSRPWAGWLGAALFLINPVVLDEFRAAYVDLSFAFFFFLAFLLIHDALECNEESRRRLILAGVFGGVAAGIKPTGVMGVACLLILYLVVSWRQRRRAGEILGGLTRIAVPAGLILAPWILKTWILTGNPVYPFLYSVWGGPEWSAELGARLKEWQNGIGMGRGWLDYFLLPWRVVIEGGRGYDHFDGRISPLWLVLVPVALLLGKQRPLVARCLAVSGLYFIFWALSSQQMRFLVPILPFLAVAGALTLADWSQRLKPSILPVFRWSVSSVVIVTLAIASSPMVLPALQMLREYQELGEEVMQGAVHPVYQYINQQLPEDARVLFLNTNHGFFCRREFMADSFFEASQINALLQREEGAGGIERALEDLGVTHLLVENRDRYIPWPESLYQYLNDPTRVRQLFRSPDNIYDVVEISGSPASRN